jgi:hypothetical protein
VRPGGKPRRRPRTRTVSRAGLLLLLAAAAVVSTRWFGVSAYAGGWSAGILCGQAWAEHDTDPDTRWTVGFQLFETPEFRWSIPGGPDVSVLLSGRRPKARGFFGGIFRMEELGPAPGAHRRWALILWPLTALSTVAGVGLSVLVRWRGTARRRRGACPACGYDLRTLADRVCPECGPPDAAGPDAR